MLEEVRSLLKHDSPSSDPLEKPLDRAIDGGATTPGSNSNSDTKGNQEPSLVDDEQFVSKLADIGVLSQEEMSSVEREISMGDPSSNPRLLASQLVTDGKITEYQAATLLNGRPELLIDKYLILDLIDTGGMGMVFKAIQYPPARESIFAPS